MPFQEQVLDASDPQNDERLKKVRETFIEWLLVPKAERRPATQSGFSQHWNVHANTLSRWKRSRYVERELFRRRREFIDDDLKDIFTALIEKAKEGSYQHIRLALEVSGILNPTLAERYRIEEELEEIRQQASGEVITMGDDELLEEIEEISASIRKRMDEAEAL